MALSISMFVYRRTSTVTYSRVNYSILSISSLSTPKPFPISTSSLFTVYDALFQHTNFGEQFNLGALIASSLPSGSVPIPRNWALKYIRNLLAVPLQFCHANLLGIADLYNNLTSAPAGLPPDMYTNVSIVEQSYRIVPGTLSLWLFGGLTSFALLLFLVAFIYAAANAGNRPRKTGFTSLDFAINCVGSGTDSSLGVTLASLRGCDERIIMKELADMRATSKERVKEPRMREARERGRKNC
jgi:hypothetical protein